MLPERGGVGAVHRCYQSGAGRCRCQQSGAVSGVGQSRSGAGRYRCYQSGAVHCHGATMLPERGGIGAGRGNGATRAGQSGAVLPERGGASMLPERGGVDHAKIPPRSASSFLGRPVRSSGASMLPERGGASPWGIDATRAGRCIAMGQRCYQTGRCRSGAYRSGRCGASMLPERGGASPRGIDATRAGRGGAVSGRGGALPWGHTNSVFWG